jgi:hypothetical protein
MKTIISYFTGLGNTLADMLQQRGSRSWMICGIISAGAPSYKR